MRVKNWFTVPEGEKVTDKIFGKVLLSSVASILLCMACLAGTTWAWFTVTVENAENVIQIATVAADVTVTKEDVEIPGSENGAYQLDAGTYQVNIRLSGDRTETGRTVYVLVAMGEGEKAQYYYVAFENGATELTRQLGIPQDGTTVSFSTSWTKPASAAAVSGDAIVIDEAINESSAETAAPVTEPSTEATAISTTEAGRAQADRNG